MRILKPLPGTLPMPEHPLADAVGLWPMNSLGNKVFDFSGNVNTLPFINAPVWVPGQFGYVPEFVSGAGDYIEGTVTGLPLSGTFVFWAYPHDWSARNNISVIELTDGTTNNRILFYGDVNATMLYVKGGGAGGANVWWLNPAVATLPNNIWTHIAVVFNSASAVVNVYKNSMLLTPTGTQGSSNPVGLTTCTIGSFLGGSNYFDGLLDNIVIYNWALSASQIALIYRESFCMFPENNMPEFAIAA